MGNSILQISLMSGLTEDSWVLIFAFVFSLLTHVVWVEVYEESMVSQRYIVGIGIFNRLQKIVNFLI